MSTLLQFIFGKVLYPVVYVMGVPTDGLGVEGAPTDECEFVAQLIAIKIMINEFTAYELLGSYVTAHKISKRAETIATFALCGFANVGSVGIQGCC